MTTVPQIETSKPVFSVRNFQPPLCVLWQTNSCQAPKLDLGLGPRLICLISVPFFVVKASKRLLSVQVWQTSTLGRVRCQTKGYEKLKERVIFVRSNKVEVRGGECVQCHTVGLLLGKQNPTVPLSVLRTCTRTISEVFFKLCCPFKPLRPSS